MASSSYDDNDGGEGVGARRMRLPTQQDTGEGNYGRLTQGRAERRGEDANDHGGHDVFCGIARETNFMHSSLSKEVH